MIMNVQKLHLVLIMEIFMRIAQQMKVVIQSQVKPEVKLQVFLRLVYYQRLII